MIRKIEGTLLAKVILSKSQNLPVILRFLLLLSLALALSSSLSFGGDIISETKPSMKSNDRKEGAFERIKESARRLERAIEKGELIEAHTDSANDAVKEVEAAYAG